MLYLLKVVRQIMYTIFVGYFFLWFIVLTGIVDIAG